MEINHFKGLSLHFWLPFDDLLDKFGTNAVFQIEIVFNWLLEYEKKSSECFGEFQEFYKEHLKIFTSKVKDLIFQTSEAIAGSYAGKNKSELIVLGKLHLLFNSDS